MIPSDPHGSTSPSRLPSRADVVIVGGGHNALTCAVLLGRAGLRVVLLEAKGAVGGATKTERPFSKVPGLGASTGAYLLGVMPPELMQRIGLELPLRRRDPHYFLPTLDRRYLLFGSDHVELKRQFVELFSARDWEAHVAMNAELGALRDDLAPAWLTTPASLDETAARYIRPTLRDAFVRLVRGSIAEYLDRFPFESDLIRAMYATTDAFSGLHGGYDSPGTGHNFLVHNMCRLPAADGTWMIVEGGMGVIARRLSELALAAGVHVEANAEVASIDVSGGSVRSVTLARGDVIAADVVVSGADPFRTRALVGDERLPRSYVDKIEALRRDGTTLKVNLAFKGLPRFSCLPEDRGQFGPTIHLLPQEGSPIKALRRAYAQVCAGELSDEPTIEWYFHTPIDPSLRDAQGHHNGALFVQWVPYALAGGRRWEDEEGRYLARLLSICDRFAPGTSELIADAQILTPAKIESYFGITRGHIHHVDNAFAFDQRAPYALPIDGLYACSAGCHPAGSVIGAAGHNAADVVLRALGRAVA